MRDRGLMLAFVFLLGSAPIVAAQGPPPLALTIEEAQARAIDASNRLAEAQARGAAAEAAVLIREASGRPQIAALAGYTRTNHVVEFTVPGPTGAPRVLYPDIPDNYRTRLDLQWPIYSGGRTDALARAARAEAAAVAGEVAVARADLRLEVARAFWAVVTARAAIDALEQGVARAQAHVADVRERQSAGLVPPNEIASAEAQESRARMLLIEARNQRDVASADLSRLIGSDLAQPIDPASPLEGAAPLPESLESLVAAARTARAERTMLERRLDAAEEQRTAAAAGRLPVVALAGGVDYARPNPRIFPRSGLWEDSWDVGVNVSWSLWDGGRTSAEVAQASSLTLAARRRLAEFDSVLGVEVQQRALEIDSGRAAVAAANDAVRAATEAHRVVTERYRAGVITQTEVLDAEVALLQAELDRTRALAAIRLAEARLARAMGK